MVGDADKSEPKIPVIALDWRQRMADSLLVP
jgi:hypothetical protein